MPRRPYRAQPSEAPVRNGCRSALIRPSFGFAGDLTDPERGSRFMGSEPQRMDMLQDTLDDDKVRQRFGKKEV